MISFLLQQVPEKQALAISPEILSGPVTFSLSWFYCYWLWEEWPPAYSSHTSYGRDKIRRLIFHLMLKNSMEAVCSYSERCRSDLQRSERRHELDIMYEKVFEICTQAFCINLAGFVNWALVGCMLGECYFIISRCVWRDISRKVKVMWRGQVWWPIFWIQHSAFTHPIHYLRVAPYLTLDRSEIKAVMIEGQRI